MSDNLEASLRLVFAIITRRRQEKRQVAPASHLRFYIQSMIVLVRLPIRVGDDVGTAVQARHLVSFGISAESQLNAEHMRIKKTDAMTPPLNVRRTTALEAVCGTTMEGVLSSNCYL